MLVTLCSVKSNVQRRDLKFMPKCLEYGTIENLATPTDHQSNLLDADALEQE